MTLTHRLAILPIAALVLAACQADSGGSPAESSAPESIAAESAPAESAAAEGPVCDSYSGDDLLGRICEAGVIKVSTDPAYPPQSELTPDGSFEGFDIDVANEIATRLGVEVQFETPSWDAITAGNWSERWDVSVGSMTITEDRKEVIDFTQPYYYTPAQMTVHADTGITDLEGLAGKTICVGEATTYLDWLDGALTLTEEAGEVQEPPEGAVATTLPTDRDCAEAWQAGRTEFEGWLSSSTTVQQAIDDGLPVELVGDPVYYEPLAVAFDKSVEDNDSLVEAVDEIIGAMHEDGTLSSFSEEWFGLDLTQQAD